MAIQVYEATRSREGNPLSVLNRQFISFSYGGKNIEDFNLIACFNGDRLSKNIYSSFEDTTTNQPELDGQLFWMSHYKPNELSFTLATDGITSQELESFKAWFVPGIERELILTEHSNRAIKARVSAAPTMSLLPFEEDIEVNIAGEENSITTKISLYKGEMNLNFIMDDPHWYSIQSYFSGELTPEIAKVIYEDNVPYISMLDKEKIAFLADNCISTKGILSLNAGQGISQQESFYLYYCGSAPANTLLSFNADLTFDEETKEASIENVDNLYIKIDNNIFTFNLPNIVLTYNNALKIAQEYKGADAIELRKLLRDGLYNYYVRAYAVGIIDKIKEPSGTLPNEWENTFKDDMASFFKVGKKNEPPIISFSFDSKTGEALGTSFIIGIDEPIVENIGNCVKSNYLIIEPKNFGGNYLEITTSFNLSNFKIDYKYMYL